MFCVATSRDIFRTGGTLYTYNQLYTFQDFQLHFLSSYVSVKTLNQTRGDNLRMLLILFFPTHVGKSQYKKHDSNIVHLPKFMAKNPVKNIPVGRGENSEISSANASLLHWDSSNSGGFPLTTRNCRERQHEDMDSYSLDCIVHDVVRSSTQKCSIFDKKNYIAVLRIWRQHKDSPGYNIMHSIRNSKNICV